MHTKVRHFTATAFVTDNGRLFLHWHKKLNMWLPPGGHIEPNEDPVEAVKREVLEEMGIEIEIVNTNQTDLSIKTDAAREILAPYTILIEDVEDNRYGKHQHIDLIYFAKFKKAVTIETTLLGNWTAVSKKTLFSELGFQNPLGQFHKPPVDVLALGKVALDFNALI